MEIRRAVLHGKCDLRLQTDSIPDEPGPNQVLVETEASALSTGTDLGNYLGDSTYVPGAPDYPRWVGYSNAGVVRAAGAQVKNLRPGERVFSTRPHQSAFMAADNELLVPIPAGVSAEQASLTYLTGLGLAALRQCRYETGENVAVIGLGVIGLSTIALARAMGANVVGVANSELRAAAAIKVGAAGCLLSKEPGPIEAAKNLFGGGEADIVILTSNSWDSYFLALDLVRYAGRVSILGFPGRGEPMSARNPLDPSPFYSKQLTLLGAGAAPRMECSASEMRFNLRRNLQYILGLMGSGRLDLSPLITHRLPSERMVEAYELARGRSKELIAAVFDWQT